MEYSRTGAVVKGAEKQVVRSKYSEDVYINNHTVSIVELHYYATQSIATFFLLLNLKEPRKIAGEDTYLFYFHLSEKISLDVSCESSA